ncbi:hypothetical protein EYF80_005239 [Liparis tanakae]|uniref:Uncharacterized protein n=1 Tax=Liparis tanakae TaxID=230148 RepID=A0A4Z2J2U8_9TELE|nr:hypothetical protein EYF80_005239 [Liparis tanakae]
MESAVLLLPFTTPFQLQQVLDNLWVSSESRVDQCTLATLVYMINLSSMTRPKCPAAAEKQSGFMPFSDTTSTLAPNSNSRKAIS